MSEWVPYKDGDQIPAADFFWIALQDGSVLFGEKAYLKGNRWGFRTECFGTHDDVTHYMPINKPDLPRAR